MLSVLIAILFFLLTPGILITLPSSKSSKIIVAIVHAVLFSAIWSFTPLNIPAFSYREQMTLSQCTAKGKKYEHGYCT